MLLKTLLALLPTLLLVSGAARLCMMDRGLASLFQLVGAACFLLVVLTHVCEELDLFPVMGWGRGHSIGHFLDLGSAILGVTLFPVGYFLHTFTQRV
jgi:hypothetical protein